MFCIYLRTNSDLCHLQHKLIGFYNLDEKCLLCGTNWIFKYSSLRFIFKGLNYRFGLHMVLYVYVGLFHTSEVCSNYAVQYMNLKEIYGARVL